MVTPVDGNAQVMVKLLLLVRVMTGAAHCRVTEPLPTAEIIIFSLTAMALIVTPLTFSCSGVVYSLLDVVGSAPLVV